MAAPQKLFLCDESAVGFLLREKGFDVYDPNLHPMVLGESWSDRVRRCLQMVVLCDALAVGKDHRDRHGPRFMIQVAEEIGMPVLGSTELLGTVGTSPAGV